MACEGITPDIRRAFVVYLASHNRPVHEVLFPTLKDISRDYERNFKGMTIEAVKLEDLVEVREIMMHQLQQGLNVNERRFLLSLVANEPEWALLEIPHLEKLPGIQWKLHNLKRLQIPILRNSQNSQTNWRACYHRYPGHHLCRRTVGREFEMKLAMRQIVRGL